MTPVPRPPSTSVSAVGLALALALVPLLPLEAQDRGRASAAGSDSTANLTGQVVSAMTGGPLESAKVVLKRAGRGAVTDSTGHFAIRDVPAGFDTVKVALIGFAEEQVPLRLKPGHSTRVTLLLSETVLKVEDITVEVTRRDESGKLAGFWKRKRHGFGHFITPEQVEQRRPQQPSDLLRMVPGVAVSASRLGRAQVRVTRNPVGKDCNPVVWLDGAVFKDFHIDELNQDDIMALEIYRGPSETPPQFRFQGEGCGTIVVWTQEGGTSRSR